MIVLDTHIWIWYISENFHRFPSAWLDQITGEDLVGVSGICCYEIALAYSRNRLEIDMPLMNWFQDALDTSGISLLPITPEISTQAVNLSPIHKDPFDRLIIATALVYDAKLASVDSCFKEYTELVNHLMSNEGGDR